MSNHYQKESKLNSDQMYPMGFDNKDYVEVYQFPEALELAPYEQVSVIFTRLVRGPESFVVDTVSSTILTESYMGGKHVYPLGTTKIEKNFSISTDSDPFIMTTQMATALSLFQSLNMEAFISNDFLFSRHQSGSIKVTRYKKN